MRCMAQLVVISVLVALAGGRAHADFPPSSWNAPPAQSSTPQQPQSAPPQLQPAPPQPQPAPQQSQPAPPQPQPAPQQPPPGMPAYGPPPYGYGGPYGYGYGAPYNVNTQALLLYESGKKSGALAVLLSLWVPGLGNIYADHISGAVVTWAAIIGGFALIVHGNHTSPDGYGSQIDQTDLSLGLLLIAGGIIYSPIDAGVAVSDYNHALAQHLGIPPEFALGVVPIRMDRNVAWGPGLSFRF